MIQPNCAAETGGELCELWCMLFACQVFHQADDLEVLGIATQLHERILLVGGTTSVFCHCLLGHGKRLEFLASACGLCFEVLSFGHAILVQTAQGIGILIQILCGDAQVTFSSCLYLTALCETFLCCIHVLVGILHLISE